MRKRLSNMRIGLVLAVAALSIAVVVTWLAGPLFGRWRWSTFTLVLVLAELVIVVLLAALDTDPNPSLRLWKFVEDPQAEFPLMGAPLGRGILRHVAPIWIWTALPLVTFASILAIIVTVAG